MLTPHDFFSKASILPRAQPRFVPIFRFLCAAYDAIVHCTAFHNGDPASVRYLYRFLVTKYEGPTTFLRTREQLEREYRISLPDRPSVEDLQDPAVVQTPTEEELALVEAQIASGGE